MSTLPGRVGDRVTGRANGRGAFIALTLFVVLGAASCSDVLGLDDLRYEQKPGLCVAGCDAGAGGSNGGAGGSASGASSGSGGRSAGGAGTGGAGTGGAASGDGGQGGAGGSGGAVGAGGALGSGGAHAGDAGDGGPGGGSAGGSLPVDPACPGVFQAPPSFEAFEAGALPLASGSGPGPGFVVEGDYFFATRTELRTYYDAVYPGADAGGTDGAARLPPFVPAFNQFTKREINYCIDPAGWVGNERTKLLEVAAAAAGAWEQQLDIRFVSEWAEACADLRIVRANGAPYTTLFATRQGVIQRELFIGDAGAARQGQSAEAMLRHAFGHVLGLGHSRAAQASSSDAGPGAASEELNEAVRWSAMRTTWCEDTPDWLFPGAVDIEPARDAYYAPIGPIERGGDLYVRRFTTRELHRLTGGSWSRVASATRAMVEVDGDLFRLSADGATIETLEPADGGPRVIGGPANHILRCGHHLCAIRVEDGSLLRHDGGWQRISGRARQFASTDSRLVRIPLDGDGVEIFDEQTSTWSPSIISGAVLAGWIFAGPSVVYATTPRLGDDGRPIGDVFGLPSGSNTWHEETGPGRHFVALLDGSLVGMIPEGWAINLRPPSGTWTRALDGIYYRIGGRNELYAEDGGGGYHVYRQGEWTDLGIP